MRSGTAGFTGSCLRVNAAAASIVEGGRDLLHPHLGPAQPMRYSRTAVLAAESASAPLFKNASGRTVCLTTRPMDPVGFFTVVSLNVEAEGTARGACADR